MLQEEEEPELILNGGLPRYTSSSQTSNLLPVVEDMEMTVDEEEEEGEEVMRNMAESPSPLRRTSPLSWEEMMTSSSSFMKASQTEEVTIGLLLGLDFCGRFASFFFSLLTQNKEEQEEEEELREGKEEEEEEVELHRSDRESVVSAGNLFEGENQTELC